MNQLLKNLQSNRTRLLAIFVWASLVSQILIVVTGGLVRLTGSGLGCPTWPKCTDDSLVTIPEQGIHGIIEFANRLLTFALLIVAVVTLVLVWKSRKVRTHKLLAPAILLVLGIPAQAILGGLTVLFNLNPWLVGGHFILSGIMISLAALLIWRFYLPLEGASLPVRVASKFVYRLKLPIALLGALSVVIGVLVTGAGPHSGDAESPRNGLDLELWQHIHSYPAYLLLTLCLMQLGYLYRVQKQRGTLELKLSLALVLALAVQAVIGVLQARLGVPAPLVALHMLGASVICALLTANFLATRKA